MCQPSIRIHHHVGDPLLGRLKRVYVDTLLLGIFLCLLK